MTTDYTDLPACTCPQCGHKLDSATGTDDSERGPVPGDVSICINCTLPLIFGEGLILRSLQKEEFVKLDPELKRDLVRCKLAVMAVAMKNRNKVQMH